MDITPLKLPAATLAAAIEKRHSSRTFNGLRLDIHAITKIEEAIARLTPLFPDVPIPEIRLINGGNVSGRLGTYGFINGARQFLIMAAGNTDAERVQAGYMFEQIILAATAAGLDTCWLGGTFRRSIFEKAMDTAAETSVAAEDSVAEPTDKAPDGSESTVREVCIVSPIGHATQQRRFSERVMRRVVRASHRHSFSHLFPGIDPATPIGPDATTIGDLLEAVRLAPSSANSQPWRASLTGNDLTFTSATHNHYTPFDMGIAYAHLVIAATAAAIPLTLTTPTPLSPTFHLP